MTFEERFNDLLQRADVDPMDNEQRGFFYVLASKDLYPMADRIFDFEQGFIKPAVLDEGWNTGGSRRLITLAFNLFNGWEANVRDVFSGLDDKNFEIALNAIRARFNKL